MHQFDFEAIDQYRKHLANDASIIQKQDLGTGLSKPIQTRKLAQSSSVRKKYGSLLSGIAHFQKPQRMLELGTCLGVSSSYLMIGCPSAQLQSVEGCTGTFEKRSEAMGIFNLSRSDNRFINKDFHAYFNDDFAGEFDLVFVDGNHQYQATLDYFSLLWPTLPEGGLIIFDDIHWSKGMEDAWHCIIGTKGMLSMDLYQFGLCWKYTNQAAHRVQFF